MDKEEQLRRLMAGEPLDDKAVPPAVAAAMNTLPPIGGAPTSDPASQLKGKTVEEIAKAATPEAMRQLYNIGMDKEASPSVRVQAFKEILDRGEGKAAQHHTVDVNQIQIIRQIQLGRGKVPEALPVIEGEIVE